MRLKNMEISNRRMKILSWVLLTALVLSAVPVLANAETGSIVINLSEDAQKAVDAAGTPLKMGLYRLATPNGEDDWITDPAFSSVGDEVKAYEADLRQAKEKVSEIEVAEASIRTIIGSGSVSPVATAEDVGGRISFGNLTEGIYFALETEGPDDIIIQSSIIPIPFRYKGTTTYNMVTKSKNTTPAPKEEKTALSGEKIWNDGNNAGNTRPDSITVNLYSQVGEAEAKLEQSVPVTESTNWKWEFTDLPEKDESGNVITYFVEETGVAGYRSEAEGGNIRNTLLTSVSGEKTWDDGDNKEGLRPASITVNLLRNNVKIDSKTVTAADDWKWEWTDLDAYSEVGQKLTYTVTEDPVTNYTTEVDGFNVTNRRVTEVSGEKTWNDNNNAAGRRPSSITVHLLRNRTEVDRKTVTAADNWSWSWKDLPKYDDKGAEYTYSIAEDRVDAYLTAVNGYNLTNTYAVNVSGEKTWNDDNNADVKRPVSITINLLRNDTVIDSRTVDETDNWRWTWTGLPAYDAAGNAITYTITEDAVANYTTVVDGYNVTNTHTHETVNVNGQKTWIDANNSEGVRPASITILLLADGTVVQTRTITAADGWAWTFNDLDKYDRTTGNEITYTITEDPVQHYTTQINGYDIVNTFVPMTGSITFSGSKTLEGRAMRANEFSFIVRENGEVVAMSSSTAAAAAGEAGAVRYPTIHYSMKDIGTHTYTVTETNSGAPGVAYDETVYTVTVTVTEGNGALNVTASQNATALNFVNTYTATGSTFFTGHKVLNGRPLTDGEFRFGAYENGALVARGTNNASGEVRFQTLHYTLADVGTHTYTVREIPGNDASVEYDSTLYHITVTVADNGNGTLRVTTGGDIGRITFVNSLKSSRTVTKVWDDADDADGLRPASIRVNLLANGTVIRTVTLSEANNWTATVTDLAEAENGAPITYTWQEDGTVPGYEAPTYAITGSTTTVTNTHKFETTERSVQKVWNHGSLGAGVKKPDSVTVDLLANGSVVRTVTLNAGNGWFYKAENLPVNENGQPITYEWHEHEVPMYTLTSTQIDPATNTTTFTNTYSERTPPPPGDEDEPKFPGPPLFDIDDYDTPLGVEVILNHVGDCFD